MGGGGGGDEYLGDGRMGECCIAVHRMGRWMDRSMGSRIGDEMLSRCWVRGCLRRWIQELQIR